MADRGARHHQAQDPAGHRVHVAFNAKHWNGRPLASITREEAKTAVYAIAERGKLTMSRRFHTFLDLFFRWAIGVGKIETNPVEHLPKRGNEVQRDRTLARANEDGSINGREIALLWRACDVEAYPLGPIIKLLLLTCCRETEIAALRWDEIRGDTIVLEGERTKNGEPHHVPLSPQAKAILAGVPRILGCPYVFTVTGKGPFTSWACGKHRLPSWPMMLARFPSGGFTICAGPAQQFWRRSACRSWSPRRCSITRARRKASPRSTSATPTPKRSARRPTFSAPRSSALSAATSCRYGARREIACG